MPAISLIPVQDAPAELQGMLNATHFPDRYTHPVYGKVGDYFYPIIHQNNWQDHSFLVTQNDKPCLWVTCGDRGDRLTHYGFPIQFFWHKDVHPDRKVIQYAVDHLRALKQKQDLRYVWIGGDTCNNLLGPLDRVCLDSEATPLSRFNVLMDLSQDEASLRKDVRKSYKSLINWGKRTFNMTYLNAQNPDQDLFAQFIDFYNDVAGKNVHSAQTWSALFELIRTGSGEISLAFHDDNMVAGSAFIDEGATCLYFIAAYDRNLFDKPIGHWPVFDACLRAKARDNQWVDLGEFYSAGEKTAKDRSIGFFKKGFSSNHRLTTTWKL